MESPFASGVAGAGTGRVRVVDLHARLGPVSRLVLAGLGLLLAVIGLVLALLLIPAAIVVGLLVVSVVVIRRKLASFGRPGGVRQDGRENVRVIGRGG